MAVVRRSILDRIFEELREVRYRLDDIESRFSSWNPQPAQVSESKLLSLPDHLRESFMVVASRGECSAVEVSNATGRSRAIESSYLNQLARMGWLSRRRASKTIRFCPVSDKVLKTISERNVDKQTQ